MFLGLQVEQLSTAFFTPREQFHAVSNVSFNLNKGEVLGLVGESACGKSITALSLLRLLPPGARIVSGRVHLNGTDLLALNQHEMRNLRGKGLACIFQDPHTALNPVRSIGVQFIETLKDRLGLNRDEAVAMAVNMLDRLGLPVPEKVMRQYPFQLSGGMKQRVIIALALCLQPEILIADEPTTALDVTVQAQVLWELNRLKKELGAGILLISHNMGVIAGMADRVAVMYGGTIVESGPVKSVFTRPAHPYTRGLLGSIPRLDQKNKRLCFIRGQPPGLAELNRLKEGCVFSPRCDLATAHCCNHPVPSVQVSSPGEEIHTAACHRVTAGGVASIYTCCREDHE